MDYVISNKAKKVTLGLAIVGLVLFVFGFFQQKDFVYADGLNLNDEKTESKIGVSCRKCDRLDCSQRAFPPDTQNYDVNINQRGVSIFVNQ